MAELDFLGCTPCLFVRDPKASARFYRDTLGFPDVELFGPPDAPYFAIVRRGRAQIFLRFTRDGYGERPWVPDRDEALFDAYIGVTDVAALRAEFAARGLATDPPVDRPYGMREIAVTDPDGYVVVFGQDIEGRSVAEP